MNGGGALGLGPGKHLGFILPPIRALSIPLFRLEHDISAAFENGKFAIAVFFNLQKVYDTTWKRGGIA